MAEGEQVKYADLHMHTSFSKDARAKPADLVDVAIATGHLDVLAITDHDSIDGALEAADYLNKHPMRDNVRLKEIVIGTEVTTRGGHIIGLYLERGIPRPPVGMDVEESIVSTVAAIHEQGGLVLIPHPFYPLLGDGIREVGISMILDCKAPEVYVDGFEIHNTGMADLGRDDLNNRAAEYFAQHSDRLGAAVGGTDGHGWTVGRGMTTFQGDLREAILLKQTSVETLSRQVTLSMVEFAKSRFPEMSIERPIHRRIRQNNGN